ncbi:MAG: HNH endonuclease [Planctomycetaceae bacterium]
MRIERRDRLREYLLLDDAHCWYCGKELTWLTATVDHLIPKSRGGQRTLDNSRRACRRCQQVKADLPVECVVSSIHRTHGLRRIWEARDFPGRVRLPAGPTERRAYDPSDPVGAVLRRLDAVRSSFADLTHEDRARLAGILQEAALQLV